VYIDTEQKIDEDTLGFLVLLRELGPFIRRGYAMIRRWPEHFATSSPDENSYQLLFHRNTPLTDAVKDGDMTLMAFLIDNGADVNAVDSDGNTPLYYAHYAHLAYRSKKRCAPEEVDESSCTATLEKLELLLKHGANVNAVISNGFTLLHFAALSSDMELMALLIKHEPNVNAVDSYGRTPLHLAAEKGDMELMELLLKHGADVNAVDSNDRTPLHNAATNEDMKLMELLVAKGAAIDVTNKGGYTPLSIAQNFNRENAVHFLEVAQSVLKGGKITPELFVRAFRSGMTVIRCLKTGVIQDDARLREVLDELDEPRRPTNRF